MENENFLIKEEEELRDSFTKRMALWLRQFLCLDNAAPADDSYTAKQASLLAYNRTVELDDDRRVKEFVAKVNKQIKHKCESFESDCTYAIPKDILKYKDKIIDYFQKKGYEVHDLMEETTFVKRNVLWIDWTEKF